MGAVSSVLDAVLRRIGFFAVRCLFFWSRHQISSIIRLGKKIRPHRGATHILCRQFAPILRQSQARKFGRNVGPNFNPRDFPENLRYVTSEAIGFFFVFVCIAFCKEDLLSRFLPRVLFVSLRTISAENQLEPGSYAVSLLWYRAFLCKKLRTRFFEDCIVWFRALRSHENTDWLPTYSFHLFVTNVY